jgi:hypothetical protein
MAPWRREPHFLSFIPQPLSFRKVPRRPGAYYVNLQNAMRFSDSCKMFSSLIYASTWHRVPRIRDRNVADNNRRRRCLPRVRPSQSASLS